MPRQLVVEMVRGGTWQGIREASFFRVGQAKVLTDGLGFRMPRILALIIRMPRILRLLSNGYQNNAKSMR